LHSSAARERHGLRAPRFFQLRFARLYCANRGIGGHDARGETIRQRHSPLGAAAAVNAVTRFQSVARSVGGIVAIHFLDVFHASHIAHQIRYRANQLAAIFGE